MKKASFLLAIIGLIIMLGSCSKHEITEPTVPEDNIQLKAVGATMSNDTIFTQPNVFTKFYVEGLSTSSVPYTYSWFIGGANVTSNLPSPEAEIPVGYWIVNVTVSGGGLSAPIFRQKTINCGQTNTLGEAIVVMSASNSSGQWIYTLGFRTNTIANFTTSQPTDIIHNWTTTTPTSNYQSVNGLIYAVLGNFILPDNVEQVFHFNQGSNWSVGTGSIYWQTVGNGQYHLWARNGLINNQPYGNSSSGVPGDNGDPVSGTNAPTIRDSIIIGSVLGQDFLRIYVNHNAYANGPSPFLSWLQMGYWTQTPLIMDAGHPGWSYYDLNISSITSGNNQGKFEFRFGPNITNSTGYGTMTNSKFYETGNNSLVMYIGATKSAGGNSYLTGSVKEIFGH